MDKHTIIYHDRCPDGMCGLCVVNKYLEKQNKSADFLGGDYKNIDNLMNADLKGHNVFFVDFSVPPEKMEILSKKANKIVVLDHHKDVLENYAAFISTESEGFKKGVFNKNVELILDMDRSGALVAWDYLHKSPAPKAVEYISDADLYRFKQPQTVNFQARLGMEKFEISVYEKLLKMNSEEMKGFLKEGELLSAYFQSLCEKDAYKAKPITIDINGVKHHGGMVVSSNELLNKVAEIIYTKNNTFAAVLTEVGDDKFKVSFRAKADNSYNVKEIANYFGGGGHISAASCYVTKEELSKYFQFDEIKPEKKIKM